MTALLAIVQLLLVLPMLGVALAIRFAGRSRPLNVVDYARVTDPPALHRWAGNRLLLLPAMLLLSGLASLHRPGLCAILAGGVAVLIPVLATWLALGAEKFQCKE